MGLLTVAFLDLEEMPAAGSNAQQRDENVSPLQRLRLGVGTTESAPKSVKKREETAQSSSLRPAVHCEDWEPIG